MHFLMYEIMMVLWVTVLYLPVADGILTDTKLNQTWRSSSPGRWYLRRLQQGSQEAREANKKVWIWKYKIFWELHIVQKNYWNEYEYGDKAGEAVVWGKTLRNCRLNIATISLQLFVSRGVLQYPKNVGCFMTCFGQQNVSEVMFMWVPEPRPGSPEMLFWSCHIVRKVIQPTKE